MAAVGRPPPRRLRAYRVVADLVPDDYRAEGLLESFPPPRATTRPRCRSYSPKPPAPGPSCATGWTARLGGRRRRGLPDCAAGGPPGALLAAAQLADAICFASSSAVDSYLDQAGEAGAGTPPIVACIGPATAATARSRGLEVSAEASEHTLDGLVGALVAALRPRRRLGRQSGRDLGRDLGLPGS